MAMHISVQQHLALAYDIDSLLSRHTNSAAKLAQRATAPMMRRLNNIDQFDTIYF